MNPMLLKVQNLQKSYRLGTRTIEVLRGIDICISEGEFLSIMGTSGSGKSTLLHILGGLDTPDDGDYTFNGRNMLDLDDTTRSWMRANWFGFVFQTFDLLPDLNVIENVALPFQYNSVDPETRETLMYTAIERVGLSHRFQHRPGELSGGEMQRVAIARALAIQPKCIFADEPTGNLDSSNTDEILQLFSELHLNGTTIIMVTHDSTVAAFSEKTVEMKDGYLH